MQNKAKTVGLQRPNVFAYHLYTSFLKDFFKYLNSGKLMNLRDLATKAGVTASFLSLVSNGKRVPSLENIQRISLALGLSKEERRAVELLYQIGESPVDQIRQESLEELQSFKHYQNENQKEIEAYRYLSKWYFVAVRELTQMTGYRHEALWIRQALGKSITISQAEEAMAFLESAGLIESKGGQFVATAKSIRCDEGVYKLSLGAFYRQIFDLASQSIDQIPRSERHLASHTFCFSKKNFEKIRKILDKALDHIEDAEKSNTDKESLYHVDLIAFPMGQFPHDDEPSVEKGERV